MSTVLQILQLISSILLALLILIQSRGQGLGGSAFGGSAGGGFYAAKRGAEKMIANVTVGTAVAFVLLSLATNLV